ncbi:TIM barrel protein [Halocatena marina]|uniref:TIM barrel protein n=1 Tax=Halocatena marina TaxID=2934937 RepID=UPI0022200263|nr:TIM barrel protein [Halocatena marina]
MRDHSGYLIISAVEGAELIKTVDSPSVKLLYDFYHAQITSGDVIRSFQNHPDLIDHTHSADTPGRHELGMGERKVRESLCYDRGEGIRRLRRL